MMQPEGKHERPQNAGSVEQLSKITSMVQILYCPSGEALYLWHIHCIVHCWVGGGGLNSISRLTSTTIISVLQS